MAQSFPGDVQSVGAIMFSSGGLTKEKSTSKLVGCWQNSFPGGYMIRALLLMDCWLSSCPVATCSSFHVVLSIGSSQHGNLLLSGQQENLASPPRLSYMMNVIKYGYLITLAMAYWLEANHRFHWHLMGEDWLIIQEHYSSEVTFDASTTIRVKAKTLLHFQRLISDLEKWQARVLSLKTRLKISKRRVRQAK